VKSALEHGLDPPGHGGKHPALEGDREQQILDRIKQSAESNTQGTKKEVKDSCTNQSRAVITIVHGISRNIKHISVIRYGSTAV
jgi:hypothetical protein